VSLIDRIARCLEFVILAVDEEFPCFRRIAECHYDTENESNNCAHNAHHPFPSSEMRKSIISVNHSNDLTEVPFVQCQIMQDGLSGQKHMSFLLSKQSRMKTVKAEQERKEEHARKIPNGCVDPHPHPGPNCFHTQRLPPWKTLVCELSHIVILS
jgi:hypothetical protein